MGEKRSIIETDDRIPRKEAFSHARKGSNTRESFPQKLNPERFYRQDAKGRKARKQEYSKSEEINMGIRAANISFLGVLGGEKFFGFDGAALLSPGLASGGRRWSIGTVDWNFKSVAVVGSGAIGLYYGGRLAAAGEDLRFLARSEYEALSRNGLKVESVHGDFEFPHPQVFRTSAEIGPVDLVIVAWKTTANPHLGEVLPPLLHAETQVLTLQNGLGNCESIAEITGPQRVLGGQCFVCINRVSPGLVMHSAGGRVALGEWRPGIPGRAAEIARRFKAAGIPSAAVTDLEQAQWEKLVWNIPFNGLSVAEGGVTTDTLLASRETEDEIRALMIEVLAAARALGHELSDALIDFNIERTRPMGPYRTSSMIDFVEGREVEVGPIWREPLLRGQAAGIAMPHTARLLDRMEQRIAGSPASR